MIKLLIILIGAPLNFLFWSGISYWFLLGSMSVQDAKGLRWVIGGVLTIAMLVMTLQDDDDDKK